MHVICDDEDIQDSPFIAHIQPAVPDCFPDKVQLGTCMWTQDGARGPSSSPCPSFPLLPLHR